MQVPLPNHPLGTILKDRYQVEHILGQGGMGVTYKALDLQNNLPVTLKALRPDKNTANPDILKRFIREGEILRELDHPNIVRLLDTFEQDGLHYLVLDYVSGGDLNVRIEAGDLPDIPTVLSIAIDIADALTRAHRLNILHRDIKPANVLLESDGTIRLTDFGIASLNTDTRLTEEGAIVGTIAYLPPEACMGLELDERADIWSFGVLLYELLLGETPFAAEQPFAVMQAILHQPLPDIQALRPAISDELADLLYRMLEKDPQARIPGVRHVGALLEDISRGRTSQPQKSVFDTPPPDIWQRPSHNLPPQSTPFVGREHELAELTRLLADRKGGFLSIISPGGMGKTRLALALAEKLAVEEERKDSIKDGVYFVELAPLSDPAAIPSAIASATGYRMSSDGREPDEQVLDFLRNKQLLLILDNFEHLLSASVLVEDIVLNAPQVSVVITSRERLGKPGEMIFHLAGMEFPDWETPEDALEYSAVKLFVNSARRARPGYELTVSNMDYIARICRLTGGMPLGIVLAASWVSVLRAEEIAEELLSGLDILEAAGDEVVDRQRSIQTVFEHTWSKLSQGEQRVFAQLSIFRGGFTREAAQAVTYVSLPMLRKLVNQSLITRDVHTGRFAIHELLRQYALRKLGDIEGIESASNAHATYFAKFVAERDLDMGKFSQKEIGDSLDADFENIRTAWSWLVEQHDHNALSGMVFPLRHFAYLRVRRAEGIISMMKEALKELEDVEETRQWQKVYGRMLTAQAPLIANFTAEPIKAVENMSLRGLDLLQAANDESGLATARALHAWFLSFRAEHRSDAFRLAQENTEHCQSAGLMSVAALNQWTIAVILRQFGSSPGRIEDEVEKGLAFSRQAGDRFTEMATLLAFGTDQIIRGEYDAAMQIYKESLEISKEQGLFPIAISSIGSLNMLVGNYSQAKSIYEKYLRISQDQGDLTEVLSAKYQMFEIAVLEGKVQDAQALLDNYREKFPEHARDNHYAQGFLAYHEGDFETACHHFERHLLSTGWVGDIVNTSLLLGHSQVQSGQIESARRSLLHGLEQAYRTERRFQYPRAIFGFASLANASGDKKEAVRLAGVVHNHRVTPHEVNVMVADLLQSLREEMSPDDYQEALDTSAALDIDIVAMKLLEELTKTEDFSG